ncbi:MAG: F0F1 ATP synthase subunit gamma [Micrococcaceae bacterium]
MGAQLRVYRQKIKATQSMGKLFNAMELIATSRIPKARKRVASAEPYAKAITAAVASVAQHSSVEHPLTTHAEDIKRVALLVIASDRGMAGAYSSNVLKKSESVRDEFLAQGIKVDLYLYGRKSEAFYNYREIPFIKSWTGHSDHPHHDEAKAIAKTLTATFLKDSDQGGVDALYIISTEFKSMVEQIPVSVSLLPAPFEEEENTEGQLTPSYDFEPSAEEVLDAMLPRYIESKVFNAILQSSASELASRQAAMKTATENADELVKKYTRLANTARQAEITQELSEIVAGADALSSGS